MNIDAETGEVIAAELAAPAMPKSVAAALCAVIPAVGGLAKTSRNNHGGYNFVSGDDYLMAVRGAMAEHHLVPDCQQVGWEVMPTAKGGSQTAVTFDFYLTHAETGERAGPWRRTAVGTSTNSQAFGGAWTYAFKYFLRSVLMIP